MLVSALILCLITSSTGAAPQRVEVMDRVTAIAGQDVTLPCTLREVGASSSVTQVTWVKDPEGQGLNLAVFSPSLGTSHPLGGAEGGGGHGRWGLRSPSPSSVPLTINSVRLEDEGKYSCEYSLFPQGKNGGQTSLTVWVEPLVSVSRLPVWAGDSRRPVAECSASNGKPGAEITWVSDFPGNTSTRETRNPNGTQSLTSRYFLVPTHNQHNRLITCSVTHPTLTRPVTIPVRLTVSYSPIVSIKKLEGNSSVVLHCLADGNPTPSVFTWSVLGGDLPKSVRVDSDRVFLNAVDISVNSTFRCEARNTVGRGQADIQVPMVVCPKENSVGGGLTPHYLLFILLPVAVVLLIVLVTVTVHRNKKTSAIDVPPVLESEYTISGRVRFQATSVFENETEAF